MSFTIVQNANGTSYPAPNTPGNALVACVWLEGGTTVAGVSVGSAVGNSWTFIGMAAGFGFSSWTSQAIFICTSAHAGTESLTISGASFSNAYLLELRWPGATWHIDPNVGGTGVPYAKAEVNSPGGSITLAPSAISSTEILLAFVTYIDPFFQGSSIGTPFSYIQHGSQVKPTVADYIVPGVGAVSVTMNGGIAWAGMVVGLYVDQPFTADCAGLSEGVTGTIYNDSITITDGSPPFCVSLVDGTLPLGLMFQVFTTSFSIRITGKPLKPGVFNFTLNITDATHQFICVSCSMTVTGTDLSCPCGPLVSLTVYCLADYWSQPDSEQGAVIDYGFPSVCNEIYGCDIVGEQNIRLFDPYQNIKNTGWLANGSHPNEPFFMYPVFNDGDCTCADGLGFAGEVFAADCSGAVLDVYSLYYGNLLGAIGALSVSTAHGGTLLWEAHTCVFPDSCNCAKQCCLGSAVTLHDVFIIAEFSNGGMSIARPNSKYRALAGAGLVDGHCAGDSGAALVSSLGMDGATGSQIINGSCDVPNTFCDGSGARVKQYRKGGAVAVAAAWLYNFVGINLPNDCPNETCATLPTHVSLICGAFVAQLGVSFIARVNAYGGKPPYSWQLIGSLPDGITFDSGTLSGIPTSAGFFQFSVTVTDSNGDTATADCSITIITGTTPFCNNPPNGEVGVAYSHAITAAGGVAPYTFSIIAGSLPTGLSMASNGSITGTPTVAGTFPFTVQVTDSLGATAQTVCSITIGGGPTLTCDSPPNGEVGVAYSHALGISGGTPPYTYAITSGSLPLGLSLNSGTGLISGTPLSVGTSPFEVQVTDTNGITDLVDCSITILGPVTGLSCDSPPNGSLGNFYSHQLLVTGGTAPYTFTLIGGALPDGLSLDSNIGTISGVPTALGNFSFTVQVTDAFGSTAQATCSISIFTGSACVVCQNTPNATVGVPYSAQIPITGGTPPYTFAYVNGLPLDELTVNASGVISGTPLSAQLIRFTVSVTDSTSATSVVTCGFSVICPPPC